MRIYTDMDLVAAESLRHRLWDGLSASELAAALSALVFETRRADDATSPRLPGGRVKQVLADMVSLWADLDALEREHKLDFLREPDLGFAWAAYRWAEGAPLDEVLTETDLAAGDFVRWVKQLLDLDRPGRRRGRGRGAAQDRPRGLRRPPPGRGGLLLGRRLNPVESARTRRACQPRRVGANARLDLDPGRVPGRTCEERVLRRGERTWSRDTGRGAPGWSPRD